MTISLVGLTYIQISWISRATKLKEEHFDKLVRQAMEDVVGRLEKDEMNMLSKRVASYDQSLKTSEQLLVGESNESGKERSIPTSSFEDLNISVNINLSGQYSFLTYAQDSLLISFKGRSQSERFELDDPLTGTMNAIQKELRSKMNEKKVDMIRTMFEDKPIESRINKFELESHLFRALEERGINFLHEFAIIIV